MGKMMLYAFGFAFILLLYYYAGLIQVSDGSLLELLLNPQDLQHNIFNLNVLSVLLAGGASAAAIFIAYYTKNVELAVMTGLLPIVTELLWGVIQVYSKVKLSIHEFAVILFAPFLFLFVLITIEWWRGRD